MINYTERIALLMQDIVLRTPRLSFIDLNEVLVFGRFGRADAEGAYATCHCLTLPESEPGYYFWRDRATGLMTRRSEWFVTKSRKAELYDPGTPGWIAKLDTVVHELFHIDPAETGIRRLERADGTHSLHSHGPLFYEHVAEMVKSYLATKPDPALYEFLQHDFVGLEREFGAVAGTTFRNFPSYPQRYMEPVLMPPVEPPVKVEPLKAGTQPAVYTETDLHTRLFTESSTRKLIQAGTEWRSRVSVGYPSRPHETLRPVAAVHALNAHDTV
jgi:hypothetical protein